MFTDEEIDVRKVDVIDVRRQVQKVCKKERIKMIIAGPPGPPHWQDLLKWLHPTTLLSFVIEVFPFHQDPSKLCHNIFEGESKVVATYLGRIM